MNDDDKLTSEDIKVLRDGANRIEHLSAKSFAPPGSDPDKAQPTGVDRNRALALRGVADTIERRLWT